MSRKQKPGRDPRADTAIRTLNLLMETITSSWKSVTLGAKWQNSAEAAVREGMKAATPGAHVSTVPFQRFLADLDSVPVEISTHLQLSMQDQITLTLWGQSRTVYLLDEDLWKSLADTDPAGEIPPEVFTRLPHFNPYVAFPHPVTVIADNGDPLRVEGMWITGRKELPDGGAVLCSTHDPDMNAVTLLFNGYSVDPETGKPSKVQVRGLNGVAYNVIDTVISRSSVPLVPATLEVHIAAALAGVRKTSDRVQPGFEAGMIPADALSLLIRTAIIALVYLCSDDADIASPSPASGSRRMRAGTGETPERVYPVGYRIGAALRQHRAAKERGEGSGGGTGRTVAPHIRRAHFHTFRAGPGRKERRVKWLPPIPVNIHDDALPVTVHKVR